MPTKRKLSIAGLFGLGWICIGVSTLRAAYLGNDSTVGEFKQPSTSWLALWAIVEASIGTLSTFRRTPLYMMLINVEQLSSSAAVQAFTAKQRSFLARATTTTTTIEATIQEEAIDSGQVVNTGPKAVLLVVPISDSRVIRDRVRRIVMRGVVRKILWRHWIRIRLGSRGRSM